MLIGRLSIVSFDSHVTSMACTFQYTFRIRDTCKIKICLYYVDCCLVLLTESVCGEGRIPYSHPEKMKAVAVGLPAGIVFKQPSLYKQPELRQIHQNLDKFDFIPFSSSPTSSSIVCSEQEISTEQ